MNVNVETSFLKNYILDDILDNYTRDSDNNVNDNNDDNDNHDNYDNIDDNHLMITGLSFKRVLNFFLFH